MQVSPDWMDDENESLSKLSASFDGIMKEIL